MCATGRTFVLRALNGWEQMSVDDLAMDPQGNLRIMRIPSMRAMAAVKSIDGHAAPPLRTDIDVQKFAQSLDASELDHIVRVYSETFTVNTPDKLKNS